MTLETLITFLTIENNNMNNYIVTFEYRVMVTAFTILAMFKLQISWKSNAGFIGNTQVRDISIKSFSFGEEKNRLFRIW